jgi:hypothetical protein
MGKQQGLAPLFKLASSFGSQTFVGGIASLSCSRAAGWTTFFGREYFRFLMVSHEGAPELPVDGNKAL